MYLAEYTEGPQLGGFLKKLVKGVTKAVQAPLKPLHNIIEKNTPNKLLPLVERVHNSVERGVAIGLNPLDAPRLVREEVKQLEDARKDPRFMSLVGKILAVVAIVYPMLQPVVAAMQLVQAAAERRAAKELMAKDQAEADAAQAEFDKYVAELAALQAETEKLRAMPIAPSPSASPVVAQPLTTFAPSLQPGFFAPRESGQGIDRELERQAASALPAWVVPAGLAAAALLAVPLLARGRARRARRREQ